jgi:monofunctional biosynthetic peptidoglycan transglycosylase
VHDKKTILSVTLLFALLQSANGWSEDGQNMLTAFDDRTPDLGWRTVNDNVMGGRSTGGFHLDGGVLTFAGSTNTNGGGFSSIRSSSRALQLDSAEGVKLRVRGDGRKYTFRLESSTSRIAYWAEFRTTNGSWGEVNLPFTAFGPRFRGRTLTGPPLEPALIQSVGLMIYDGQDGPFQLDVDWIESIGRGETLSRN